MLHAPTMQPAKGGRIHCYLLVVAIASIWRHHGLVGWRWSFVARDRISFSRYLDLVRLAPGKASASRCADWLS